MNLKSTLDKYRLESLSQTDKGDKFEKLTVNFLKTFKTYHNYFAEVHQWKDWSFHESISAKDTGIDLVAKTNLGKYWAIQCKCYDSKYEINKSSIDSFIATSGKKFKGKNIPETSFDHRLIISTTNKWTSNALGTLEGQTIPCSMLKLVDLENAQVDWQKLDEGIYGLPARLPQKTILDHQKIAINECIKSFKTNDRGKLIMACGTGKTFTSLKIAEQQTKGEGLVIFFAPSISLIGQTVKEWKI
jgi:predicted helicase